MEFDDGVLYSTPFGGVIKRKDDGIGSKLKNTQNSTWKTLNIGLGENSNIRNDENIEIFSQSRHDSDFNRTCTYNPFSIDNLFMNSEFKNSECVKSDFKSITDQCFKMVDNNTKPQSFGSRKTWKDKPFTGNTKITSYFPSSVGGMSNKNNFQVKSKNLTGNKQFHDSLKRKINKDSCVDLMLSETIRNDHLDGSELYENKKDRITTPNKNVCNEVKKQEIQFQDSKNELFSDKKIFHNRQDAIDFPTDLELAEFSGNINKLSPSVSNFNFISKCQTSNSDEDPGQNMLSLDLFSSDIISTEVFPNVNKNESFKTELNHNFKQSGLSPSKTLLANNSEITDIVNEESIVLSSTVSIDLFASQSFSGVCSKSQILESINIDGLEYRKNNNDNENMLKGTVEEQKKSEKSHTKNMTNCEKEKFTSDERSHFNDRTNARLLNYTNDRTNKQNKNVSEIKMKDELGNETEIMESKSDFDSQSILLEKPIYFKKPIGIYKHKELKYKIGAGNCKDNKVNNENKERQNCFEVCFTGEMKNQSKQSSNENINNSKSENDSERKVSETNISKQLKMLLKTNEKTPGTNVKKLQYDSAIKVMKQNCNDLGKPNVNNTENAQNKGVLKYFPCKKKTKLKNKIIKGIKTKVKENLINERMQINVKDEGFNNKEIRIKHEIKEINTMGNIDGKIKDPIFKINTTANIDGKIKEPIGIINTVSNIDKETKTEPTMEASKKRNVIIPEMFNKKYLESLGKNDDKNCGSLKRLSEVQRSVRKKPAFVPPWKKPLESQVSNVVTHT